MYKDFESFRLTDSFLEQYRGRQPEWGPLGYIVFKRTYSRSLPNGETEEFWQTLQRVVEGTYAIQKTHCRYFGLPWNQIKAQKSAQRMFELMWQMKFLPPGRGLWAMGTDYVKERSAAPLLSCGFASTKDIATDFADPFMFLMDMSMLGVGVGGDTKGAGTLVIKQPKKGEYIFTVPDTREGWCAIAECILLSYAGKAIQPQSIDYSLIRPAGTPIKTFGGIAAGPEPLRQLVEVDIPSILDPLIGKSITSTAIVDIFNYIGKCVVSGNVRRSSEIMFGEPTDEDFLLLKDPSLHKAELEDRRWSSNNSVIVDTTTDFSRLAELTSRNGEPGFFWLKNAQMYGRTSEPPSFADARAVGGNPCMEQTLENMELCCTSGDTKILTSEGYRTIEGLTGKEVKIWNGLKWSKVSPFIAGKNKALYRVSLTDGSHLDVTNNHEWSVKHKGQRFFSKLSTIDLLPNMILEQTELARENMESNSSIEYPYAWGFFTGDGFLDRKKIMISLHGKKDYIVGSYFEKIGALFYKEQHPTRYSEPFRRVNLTALLKNLSLAKSLNNKYVGIPETIFSLSSEQILEFVAGWIDSDGHICKQDNTDNYRIFGSEPKIRDLQLLLRQVGINHASIYRMSSKGEQLVIQDRLVTRNHDLWVCYIPTYECASLAEKCIIKKATRIGSRFVRNNAHKTGKFISRVRNQRIVSVQKLEGLHIVYCFTEPERHMGMFGNCLTYQCLVENFIARCDSLEEFKEVLKHSYLYAKTVTLLPTHNQRANAVMMRNRRIGCSLAGISRAIGKLGYSELTRWLDEGYRHIRNLDAQYSEWFCVPESVKISSVKPGGTTPLLPGEPPGMHFPHSEYYIRNIRIGNTSPLIDKLIRAGYSTEKDTYTPNTIVVSFPVHEKNFTKSKYDVSIWEQVELEALLQAYWADNMVSATITFKPEEAKDIKAVLEMFSRRLKSISFLPLENHQYQQAPYITISKEEYERLTSQINEIDFSNVQHEVTDKFCDGDKCEIPLKT